MNGWIEIFRTGRHTDRWGRAKEFTEEDLDRIITTYNPAEHEAPAVVGHPKNNDPAYGWVEKLRRVGQVLEARFKQVVPEFAEMVKTGRFKKRSVSLYPDGRLRHVGFLGAVPPAVKGLKDIAFEESADCWDFEQPLTEEQDMEKEELERQLAEEKTKREAAEQKAREAEEKNARTAAEFAEARKKARGKEIRDFIDDGIKTGKILPAWKEQGLAEFMACLDGAGGEYEFSEGKKSSPGTWFREFLEGFGAHPLFKEMTGGRKPGDGGDGGAKIDFSEPLTNRV